MMGWVVPTDVKTTSDEASSSTRSSRVAALTRPAASAGRPATTASVRSAVRLATTTLAVAPGVQGLGDALAHLPRSHHQHAGAGQALVTVAGGQCHRPVGQRGDPAGDGRLRADPLAGLDGMAEERPEHRARHLLALRPLPGPAYLPEHLGLPQHRRVEPGGHREQVAGDVVVEAHA